MKLNQDQYNEMINKLADEITEGFEVTAGANLKGMANGIKKTFSGKNLKDAIANHKGAKFFINTPQANLSATNREVASQALNKAKGELYKRVGQTAGAYGAVGALGAGAGVAARKALGNKDQEMAEKAAAVYEYALNKIALCEELYQIGLGEQEGCLEILAENGLLDESGLNKEAAESSDEAYNLTEIVANEYNDACEKIAAAEECYASSMEELNGSLEVLAELGYDI